MSSNGNKNCNVFKNLPIKGRFFYLLIPTKAVEQKIILIYIYQLYINFFGVLTIKAPIVCGF